LAIDKSGNVGIGTTSPGSLLELSKTQSTNDIGETIIFAGGVAGTTDRGYVGFGHTGSGEDTLFTGESADSFSIRAQGDLHLGGGGNNLVMTIDSSNVGIGTSSPSEKLQVNGNVLANGFYYSSDERLKENIVQIDNAISIVESLEGVSFNWKENGEESIGLIANDVEKILPEIVSTDNQGYKSIQYANLVAVLIEAVKEQQKQIDELQEKLN